VTLGWNKSTPASYYLNAIQFMVDEYAIKNFTVITDDLKYASGLLKDCIYEYEIKSNDMISDFFTIAASSKRIIGGSSFAIWASALGCDDDDVVVIAPEFNVLLPNQIRIKL
jgi:hypothetical protein